MTDWTQLRIAREVGASESTVRNIAEGAKVRAKHPDLALPDTKAYRVATIEDESEQRAVAEYAADPDVSEPDPSAPERSIE